MTDRIRGRRLQAIRKNFFERHPLCCRCEQKGLVRSATELDHIVALANGGKDVDSNRQGLCEPCHKAKTALDLGYQPRVQIGSDGWPMAG